MESVWAYALYTPYGRVSDWFPSPSSAPQPYAFSQYRTREMELSRRYIGDFSESNRRRIFHLADENVRGYDQCRRSPQARLRDRLLLLHLDEMLADAPSIGPAD